MESIDSRQTDDHKNTNTNQNYGEDNVDSEAPTYPLERLMIIIQPLQRLLGFRYINFKRVDQQFLFPKAKILYFAMFVIFVDMICYIIKIYFEIRADRLSEAQQVGAVFSIEIFCFSRGITLLMKHRDIARIFNEINRIYPRSKSLQRRMKLPAIVKDLEKRFSFYYHYTTVSFIIFVGKPALKYVWNRDTSVPVADEYHQHASWLPFGIKQSHSAYPFVFVYETYLSVGAVSLIMTWDHIFTIVMSQLCMHFETLSHEVLQMNCRHSRDPAKVVQFFDNLREYIVYMQHLNRLGAEFNAIFDLSILISDRIAAMAVCFLIFLVTNTDEWMARLMYIFPCSVLIWLTYDISKQGTQLGTLTGNIRNVLYQQNWFEGSLEYRRYVIMWMQHANEPFKLMALKLFEVNMEHFQDTMLLAYQMLTFLQSRKG